MNDTESKNKRLGSYITCNVVGENYQAFLPPPLPPSPPIDLVPLQKLLVRASQALGRLDGVSDVLPDSKLLLYYYIRKEAVLSSQIEGTQSSLSDYYFMKTTGHHRFLSKMSPRYLPTSQPWSMVSNGCAEVFRCPCV